jgi:polar amino acid transport system substrate-binding protein
VGRRPGAVAWVLVLLVLGTGACGMPRDTEGTLERLRGGTLRAGVVAAEPWTAVAGGQPEGVEVDLVRAFAARTGADLVWVEGGETSLVDDLHHGRLDVVVGGLTSSSPWGSQVALTRPYVVVAGPEGTQEQHVMAVRAGENALLVALEHHLAEHAAAAAERVGGRLP